MGQIWGQEYYVVSKSIDLATEKSNLNKSIRISPGRGSELKVLKRIPSQDFSNFYAVQIVSSDNDHVYFIHRRYFKSGTEVADEKSIQRFLTVDEVLKTVEKTLSPPKTCPPVGVIESSDDSTSFTPPPGGTYQLLTQRAEELRKKMTPGQCRHEIFKYYGTKEALWGNLSKRQRALKLWEIINEVWSELKHFPKGNNKYPNYFSPVIGPEVALCIAFQENGETLSPHAINYTFFNDKIPARRRSTAVGFGQMTRSTLRYYRDTTIKGHPPLSLLPLTTKYTQKYDHLSATEIHRELSDNVHLQIEVLFRTINEKTKIKHKENAHLNEEDFLMLGVSRYDTDNKSVYIRNVRNCLRCMKNPSNITDCM